MRPFALGCASLVLALAVPARAQDPPPRNGRPVRVEVTPIGGNGHSETWDGRVFIVTQNYSPAGGTVGWIVRVLRPENIGTGPGGAPDFGNGAFSDPVPLELDGAGGTGMTAHNAVAVTPAPGRAENPFRSDRDGNPQWDGPYETYDLLVYTQYYQANDDQMGVRRGRIIVRDARTPQAAIERAELTSPFEALRQPNGQPLRGIEPTVTFDDHLMVWQGHPANDGQIDVLMYSYNQTAGATSGWSQPRSIPDMYHVDRGTTVAGLRFDERFPIAQQPLRAADGSTFNRGELYHGSYPWLSQDGSELVHATVVAGTVNVDRARRGGLAIIGRLTGFQLWHMDNPLNRSREGLNGTLRLFFSSPGLTPGFWTPFRDVAARPLPYTGGRPTYPLFGSNSHDYGEVSFEDADGDHVLVLHLNELITKGAEYDVRRTADTSGNSQTALLEGAAFPNEQVGRDEQQGAVGQGLYFNERARVRVPRPQGLASLRDALTVELFVKRLVNLDQDAENRYRVLLRRAGQFSFILEENGAVHATVNAGGQERRSGGVGLVPMDRWTHVACTYEASGWLRVFVDGALVSEQSFPGASLDASSSDFILGPDGLVPSAPFVGANDPIVMLDEVRLSRVARNGAELARNAFRDLPRADLSGRLHVPLPRGLATRDLRIPAGHDTTAEAAELGKLLFFDPRLSRDGSIACSTCHDPAHGFSDGFPRAAGINGVLERNTPTIVNRALSSWQFFDGRAASLEEQAPMPIEHPDEMDLPIGDAVRFLTDADEYRRRFERAFGSGPSRDTLGRALAAFQRTVLSGDSRLDRFEAGDRGALSPSEERGRLLFHGRARCAACHVGANFTDELFHATNQGQSNDEGRAKVTGRVADRGRFKTPTLRDISRSGPYLHDGSAGSLEAVVDLYERGGARREGRDVEVRPLGLSPDEKNDLVAFLRALDGTTVNVTAPALPPGPGGSAPPGPGMPSPTPPPPAPTPSPTPPTPSPTPPNPTPTPPMPTASPQDARWVAGLYRDLLGRAGSQAEIDGQLRALQGANRLAVVCAFLSSEEYLARQVDRSYQRYLKRGADAGGLSSFVRRLQTGWSVKDLDAVLLASQEYRGAHPGDDAFVTGLYEDVLGRAPDAGGLAANVAGLAGDHARAARAFLDSREHHERFVERVWTDLLGRLPGAGEVAAEASALDGGRKLEELIATVAASNEYHDRQP